MTRDLSQQISAAFEALNWNHRVDVLGSDHRVTLQVSQVSGTDLLSLFGVLAPNGVPIPDVTVTLSSAGLVVN